MEIGSILQSNTSVYVNQCSGNTIPKFHVSVTASVFRMAAIIVACVDQAIDAMRCLSLDIICMLMQVRYNADICQAVRTDSAYCFDQCFFGI